VLSLRRGAIFHKIAVFKKLSKILQKSSQKASQNHEKSIKKQSMKLFKKTTLKKHVFHQNNDLKWTKKWSPGMVEHSRFGHFGLPKTPQDAKHVPRPKISQKSDSKTPKYNQKVVPKLKNQEKNHPNFNPKINQSINLSINQSINQSIRRIPIPIKIRIPIQIQIPIKILILNSQTHQTHQTNQSQKSLMPFSDCHSRPGGMREAIESAAPCL
jgi:hypothetical protein